MVVQTGGRENIFTTTVTAVSLAGHFADAQLKDKTLCVTLNTNQIGAERTGGFDQSDLGMIIIN